MTGCSGERRIEHERTGDSEQPIRVARDDVIPAG